MKALAIGNVLLPVMVLIAAGFLLGRLTKVASQPLLIVAFYVFQPALIFQALYSNSVSGTSASAVFTMVFVLHGVMLLVAILGGRVARWDGPKSAAAALAFTFNNTGAYGLPVLLFAFGNEGLALGVVYLVAHSALQATLAVAVASWRRGISLRGLLADVLRVPWIYALALALMCRLLHLPLPGGLTRSVDLLASGAIPLQLILLGLQLSQVRIGAVLQEAMPIAAAKLALPVLIAFGLSTLLGLDGLARNVVLVQASTPAAMNSLVLALHFDRRPELVAAVILLTTICSCLTVGLLLAYLM